MNDESVAPPPGRMPMMQPRAVPLSAAGVARRTSSRGRPELQLRGRDRAVIGVAQVLDDLAEAENADRDRHEVDAVHERRPIEGEAAVAGVEVDADDPKQQADQRHAERLEDRAAGDDDGADQAERHQRAIFRRAEGFPDHRQRRRGKADDERRDHAGEQRGERRRGQRRSGAALLRHRVAVERGHDGRRFARHVDQDRRRRAAVLRAVEDAGQHDEAGHRLEIERHRQHQRDGRDRTDARQHADQRAAEAADQADQQVGRRQRDTEAEVEVVPEGPLRAFSRNSGHRRSGSFSTTTKISTESTINVTIEIATSLIRASRWASAGDGERQRQRGDEAEPLD